MADQKGGQRLKILILEAYDGGSHAAFLDILIRNSRHAFHRVSLPARKWKWRMRGSAIWFGEALRSDPPGDVDLILTSDMTSVSDLRALLPDDLGRLPILCYFHENQLTYPLSSHDRRDYQFAFTNITSCLAADEVWFNSRYHRRAFLEAAADLLRKMPDHVPPGVVQSIETKSRVFPPLVELPAELMSEKQSRRDGPPIILWCHRWEYDKNPEPFFRALIELDDAGCDFRLVLLGESFREIPQVFQDSWPRLMARTIHRGFAPSREDYWRLLSRCDIVVSTAIQENFGIAVAEAMLSGCRPLLPNRLSYPELIPESLHNTFLYDNEQNLQAHLIQTADSPYRNKDRVAITAHLQSICGASECISVYDNELCNVASRS